MADRGRSLSDHTELESESDVTSRPSPWSSPSGEDGFEERSEESDSGYSDTRLEFAFLDEEASAAPPLTAGLTGAPPVVLLPSADVGLRSWKSRTSTSSAAGSEAPAGKATWSVQTPSRGSEWVVFRGSGRARGQIFAGFPASFSGLAVTSFVV